MFDPLSPSPGMNPEKVMKVKIGGRRNVAINRRKGAVFFVKMRVMMIKTTMVMMKPTAMEMNMMMKVKVMMMKMTAMVIMMMVNKGSSLYLHRCSRSDHNVPNFNIGLRL